jgi:general secretion pathway protein A
MVPACCEHFGLTRQPFAVSPDPTFFYQSPSHRAALAHLIYGIKARRGFVVLTGEVGTGKTTVIHSLLRELNDGRTHIASVSGLISNPTDLLRSVCDDLDLIPPREHPKDIYDYLVLLNRFLLDSYRKGDDVALILDEAQNLSVEVLESVRLLSNFETSQDKLVQTLLVGQPELGARLNAPELRQLKQRVAVRHHLSPLSLAECKEYIARRLEVAGGGAAIFPASAVEAIYAYSGGIPRLINVLCNNGMLTAYVLSKQTVEAEMIEEAALDLNLPVPPGQSVTANAGEIAIQPKEAAAQAPPEQAPPAVETVAAKSPALSEVEKSFAVAPPKGGTGTDGGPKQVGAFPESLRRRLAARVGSNARQSVPAPSFDRMISALTVAMGPMAALVVRERIGGMGESLEAFPRWRFRELVELTSLEILSERLKVRYYALMSEEIRALRDHQEGK